MPLSAEQFSIRILLGALLVCLEGGLTAQPWIADLTGFNPNDFGFGHADQTPTGSPLDGVVLPDGRIVVVGNIQKYDGVSVSGVVRLLPNGRIDTTLQVDFDSPPTRVLRQPDGKLLVSGAFSICNGQPAHRIVRIHPNGELDSTFHHLPFQTNAQHIRTMALQPDGHVLIGGSFTSIQGIPRSGVARVDEFGVLDTTFNPGTGFGPWGVVDMKLQPDGRILAAGSFQTFNGVPCSCIARLMPTGSLDTTFQTGSGFALDWTGTSSAPGINRIALRPDGRIVVLGEFTEYDGGARQCLAQLMPDGSLDTTFQTGAGLVPDNVSTNYNALLVRPDESLLLNGHFTTYNNQPSRYAVRIFPDGSLDTAFIANGGPERNSFFALSYPGDMLIIGGRFNLYDHLGRAGLVRVKPDGTLDQSFAPWGKGFNEVVFALAETSDEKLLAAGRFTSYNGMPRNGLARLHLDGTLDTSFVPALEEHHNDARRIKACSDGGCFVLSSMTTYDEWATQSVRRYLADGARDTAFYSVNLSGTLREWAWQSDGSVIIGGSFSQVDGHTSKGIARLHPNGGLDTTFLPTLLESGFLASATVQALACQVDDKILVGGLFTQYLGEWRPNLIRLNSDGSVDNGFVPNENYFSGVGSLVVQPDGRILVGGTINLPGGTVHTARLLPDGSIDPSFTPGALSLYPSMIKIRSDGNIVLAGLCTTSGCGDFAVLSPDGALLPDFTEIQANGHVFDFVETPGAFHIAGSFTELDGIGRNRIARYVTDFSTAASTIPVGEAYTYPNPSHDLFRIARTFTGAVDVLLATITGTVMRAYTVQPSGGNVTLDLSDLPAGVYLAALTSDDARSVVHLVKQ